MHTKNVIVLPYDPNWKADFEAARDAFRHLDKPHLRTHHLYVCPQDSREPLHHLAFRNYLRQHPEAARKYSLVKETAARLFPNDIDKYMACKAPCIEESYALCGLTRPQSPALTGLFLAFPPSLCYTFPVSNRKGDLTMETILVAGGAGYIGSHMVALLVERGYDVVVVDNLSTGHAQAVKGARFYEGDLRDGDFLEKVFSENRIHGVINFAAFSLVAESVADPLKYYNNNVGGATGILTAMKNHGVKRIVFSSTAATYGEPEQVPILETDKTVPTNCYGQTKLSMEQMMSWVSRAHGLRYVALRYFNACGAHPSGAIGEAHNPETHLIPVILQVPNGQREKLSIFGGDYPTKDGTCVRDYIHVTDLAQAHILALDYLIKGGENNVFNLGNGVGFTVKEVIDVARKVTGHAIPAEICPRRAGDPAQLVASSDKAKTVLGWKPQFNDLETIVSSAWAWHKAHPHGFEG